MNTAQRSLERSRILRPLYAQGLEVFARFRSNMRPIRPLPQLVGGDSPDNHLGPIQDKDRQPFVEGDISCCR